jgi:hypothetical protein
MSNKERNLALAVVAALAAMTITIVVMSGESTDTSRVENDLASFPSASSADGKESLDSLPMANEVVSEPAPRERIDAFGASVARLEVRIEGTPDISNLRGVLIDEAGAVLDLVFAEDGSCSVPSGHPSQVVVGADHASVVARTLPALEPHSVESIVLTQRSRLRLLVTIDGKVPEEPLRFGHHSRDAEPAHPLGALGRSHGDALKERDLLPGFPLLEVDQRGLIEAELPAQREKITLTVPPGFLVNEIDRRRSHAGEKSLLLHLRGELVSIDLLGLPRVVGRALWDPMGEPYIGELMVKRVFAATADSATLDDFSSLKTRSDGGFTVALNEILSDAERGRGFRPGKSRARAVTLRPQHPLASPDQRFTVELSEGTSPRMVGDILVKR